MNPILIRWGAILLTAVALFGFGVVKGKGWEQDKNALERAEQIVAQDAANAKLRQSFRDRETEYLNGKVKRDAERPGVAAGIARLCVGVRNQGGVPAASRVPGQRNDPAPRTGTDGRGPDLPEGLGERIAHDATEYAGCYAQVNLLVDLCKQAGCDKE